MSNITNNLLLTDTTSVNNTGHVSEQVTKETPSLFDSLLSSISSKEETSVENSSTLKEVKTPEIKVEGVVEEVKTDVVKLDVVKIEENKVNSEISEDNSEVKEKISNTTSSLLDRLIIEAKKDVKKEDLLNNKIDVSLAEVKTPEIKVEGVVEEVKTDVVKLDAVKTEENKVNNGINASAIQDNIIEIKNDILKVEEKVINNIVEDKKDDENSLLDRLIVEAKKDVKEINNEKPSIDKIDKIISSELITDSQITNTKNLTNDNLQIVDNVVILEDEIVNEAEVETIVVKKDEKLSLMDKLIQKNSEKIITLEEINNNIDAPLKESTAKDFITSIYLGSQKNQVNNQSLFNKNEAITTLKEGTSIQAVKTSAEILELGLENIEVEQTVENKLDIKKSNVEIVDRKNLIDNILSQKNVKSEEIKHLITQSVEASKALMENNITIAEDTIVNVNSPLSYNIQSKIIGAKQQMATMMSDIARQMYENYKPPVTAFRINLNPTELGSIAILMRNDKNSGLSIMMSVSNSVTLDTLMGNQEVLKNSLNKTFDESTKFNLDFSSSNQDSNNSSSNNQANQQSAKQMDTQSILQLKEENKDKEEKIIDYM
jgi:hypothetical protein